jgi:arabinogalactan oligomer / maltooligosaccharide transport system substrate-binding protein/arabinogalactan oligomer / maltooligosaccharide transport system permease protein
MSSRWIYVTILLVVSMLLAMIGLTLRGCNSDDPRRLIIIWHPLRPTERALLDDEIRRFELLHPEIRVRGLYKDIEELRSAFQAAALAGSGPDLVYGPSDVLDTYQSMGILQDMGPWFTDDLRAKFIKGALTFLPDKDDATKSDLVQVGDRFGTHLALVYNRRFIKAPPTTTDELVALAKTNTLEDRQGGRKERYGLVWNFNEPYFAIPFLTGYGAWVFEEPVGPANESRPIPALDTQQSIAAYQFIKNLHDVDQVVPANCDYDLADSLFKTGRAAMIINGDWSWTDYLNDPDIDAVVAPLPIVSATGRPMQSMIAPKGFSLNANSTPENATAAMAFVRHMIGSEAQSLIVERLHEIPVRRSTYEESSASTDPTYRVSKQQLETGRMMPVATEMRAVWDAMRPCYQAVLGGNMTAEDAASQMQRDALRKIELMHRKLEPAQGQAAMQFCGVVLLALWLLWQRKTFRRFFAEWSRNRIAYWFLMPAMIAIFAVIVFPFIYNILLSLSDMSLVRFKNWRVVGFQNYAEVLSDPVIWRILAKTVVWTVVNVTLQAGVGLLLAVALNGPIRGKSLYRILLFIPWAVPAYITALTWRGMFNYEYGVVNLLLEKAAQIPQIVWLLNLAHLTPPVNWLGEPIRAFEACIVTNVWLGFPFMMVIALGGMQGIPSEIYEAARIDRASRWQQFWHITLPLLKPVLLPAITLGAIWTFNNLNVMWLVSNGGEPQDKTHILVSYVYKAVFNLYRYGYGAALSMVIFVLLLVFTMTILRRHRATENVYG